MVLPRPLLRATFLSRPNRFGVWVDLCGRAVYAHMPNPGRMHELLVEGAELWVRQMPSARRRTTHEVVLARQPASLVCLDSRLPPELFLEAVAAGLLPELGECGEIRREVRHGASRLDLEISCNSGLWLVEAKSCTLVAGGQARFPDAPTTRGARHLRDLVHAAERGFRPAVGFLIQRSDAKSFAPNDETDPVFGAELREAAQRGVAVFAVRCEVTHEAVVPVERVRVQLA